MFNFVLFTTANTRSNGFMLLNGTYACGASHLDEQEIAIPDGAWIQEVRKLLAIVNSLMSMWEHLANISVTVTLIIRSFRHSMIL